MASTPTPHISAKEGDFAEFVLMPGDPIRAKNVAEKFFTDAVEVTRVRNALGFTGYYQGKRVSVMSSGMGIPSMSIYSHELFSFYGVEKIIRIGSCGAISRNIKLNDVVVAMGASTDSNVNRQKFLGFDFASIADYGLLKSAVDSANRKNINCHVGNMFSSDVFYTSRTDIFPALERMGILAVEMEAAGLYSVASELGKKALAICTVSDHITLGGQLSSLERETNFDNMVQMALGCL